MQVAFAHFQRAECFQERTFQSTVQSHDFAGGFHLGTDFAVCQGEFFKWPSWEFAYHIVDGWFEASLGISCNGIGDFVQVHTESNLRCHFRNRVTGGFGSQGRRTADTRVDFDDVVLVGLGVQAVLYVTSPFNLKVANDVQRSGTEHLVLSVGQGLGRCYDDGVAGVYADWVDIFHSADDDAVVGAVAHDFKFDFFPASDAAFYQNLVDWGELNAAVGNFFHFIPVMSDTAAGAA